MKSEPKVLYLYESLYQILSNETCKYIEDSLQHHSLMNPFLVKTLHIIHTSEENDCLNTIKANQNM